MQLGDPTDLAGMIENASNVTGVPSSILSSLINTESSGNPWVTGSAGEIGLTQLLPQTAYDLGVNPYDPASNVMGGASLLSSLYNQYGSWQSALSAYNTGSPNSSIGLSYAQSVLNGANYPTTTPSPFSPSSYTSTGTGATPGSTTPTGSGSFWEYGLAAVLVIGLLLFGVWGIIKE